jgi:hypothetical protein
MTDNDQGKSSPIRPNMPAKKYIVSLKRNFGFDKMTDPMM